jgi:endonuclease/exonuclease/phosphatase family metal-dependent hydrolase
MKKLFLTLKILGAVLAVLLLAAIVYVAYVIIDYERLPDNLECTVDRTDNAGKAEIGKEYTIVTQNVGFGAYTPDFTFFMDGGTESRAESLESVISCIDKAAERINSLSPDFVLFQEVDLYATRSFHTDQYAMLRERFGAFCSTYAQNYDSAYLMYPIFEPHGASKSSIATFSKLNITSSLRRSMPISTSFSKFLDLDRCYSVSRIEVEGGKELLLYNVHSSAYGGNDEIRRAQMTMLLEDMEREYKKGNYIVCGGDFNHDFTGSSVLDLNGYEDDHGWAQPFPEEYIPKGFSRCISYKDGKLLPTCRNCDVPYKEGNFTIIVDGFITSDNVECIEVENIDTNFEYADHAPVRMVFKLK